MTTECIQVHKHLREQPSLRAFSLPVPPGKRRCTLLPHGDASVCQRLHALIRSSTEVSPDDVQRCLEESPDAVKALDYYGRSAMYHAIKENCSETVIKMLFHACPESMLELDMRAINALGLLYDGSKPTSLLEYVLEHSPHLALWKPKSFSGSEWVRRICQHWCEGKECDNATVRDPVVWTKLLLTIKAAHKATFGQPQGKDEELHWALELGLSSEFLKACVRAFPRQVCQPMSRHSGMHPLHYLLNQRKSSTHTLLIQSMVHNHPQAAAIVYQGRLPLHMALARGYLWNECVKDLALAYPLGLHQIDQRSGLPPAMLAASARDSSLDTIFRVLRESPLWKDR